MLLLKRGEQRGGKEGKRGREGRREEREGKLGDKMCPLLSTTPILCTFLE